MSPFLPDSVRELFADALERVPRPLDRDVIAKTFQVIEGDSALRTRYEQECAAYGSAWTVNKFGGMAVRDLLGWDKETGNSPLALRYTRLTKTYTRLIPPDETQRQVHTNSTTTEGPDSVDDAEDKDTYDGLEEYPEIQEWVTLSEAARMLGMTRANVHKKVVQRDFKSTHRLGGGEHPYLVLLKNEVESMKTTRETAQQPTGDNPYPGSGTRPRGGSSGKTTVEEFLSRCSDADHEYFDQLFQSLREAHLKFWMGEKGFSIGGIMWGYPTFECRRHGLYLQMEQIPKAYFSKVQGLLSVEAGIEPGSSIAGKNPQFATGQLAVGTVVRIVETAIGRK